jgi:hypothetical protein
MRGGFSVSGGGRTRTDHRFDLRQILADFPLRRLPVVSVLQVQPPRRIIAKRVAEMLKLFPTTADYRRHAASDKAH